MQIVGQYPGQNWPLGPFSFISIHFNGGGQVLPGLGNDVGQVICPGPHVTGGGHVSGAASRPESNPESPEDEAAMGFDGSP